MRDGVIIRVPDFGIARGENGFSPSVTVQPIDGGHLVTVIDADHPDGQTFSVLDGDPATIDIWRLY